MHVADAMNAQLSDSTTDDFALLRRNDWIFSVGWLYSKYLLSTTAVYLSYPILSNKTRERLFARHKKNRIASDDFPPHSFIAEGYCCAIMIIYSGVFLCAWTFYFPTATERILWRAASIMTVGISFPLAGDLVYLDYFYFGRSRHSRRERDSIEAIWEWMCKVMGWQISSPKRTARTAAMREHLGERPWLYYLPKLGRA